MPSSKALQDSTPGKMGTSRAAAAVAAAVASSCAVVMVVLRCQTLDVVNQLDCRVVDNSFCRMIKKSKNGPVPTRGFGSKMRESCPHQTGQFVNFR